ncbi:MAG: hypothetical protein U0412_07345 [Nitrospira sp.]
MHRPIRSIALLLPLLALAATVQASPKLERIAIQLTGAACTTHRSLIHDTLIAVTGVRAIDLTSIPDHALVDIDPILIQAHDLPSIIERVVGQSECRAEPMESCISAGSSHASADTHRPTGEQPLHR